MYVKIMNGLIQPAQKNFYLKGGEVIVNFNKSENEMKKHGFKLLIDVKPSFNEDTQFLSIVGYTETEDSVIVNYKVFDIIY